MPVLTVAIPSFRRAAKLECQLSSLHGITAPFAEKVLLLVAYNESGDDTPEVCRKWQAVFGERLEVRRQQQVQGMLANIAYCYLSARTEYVWVLGDDDKLQPELIPSIIDLIETQPGLRCIHANHWLVSLARSVRVPMYPYDTAMLQRDDGRQVIEYCLCQNGLPGLYFVSSIVVRREDAVGAITSWPECIRNLALVSYIAAWSAAHGPAALLGRPMIEADMDGISWRARYLQLIYHDEVEVLAQLRRLGYDTGLLRRLATRRFRSGALLTRMKLLGGFLGPFAVKSPVAFARALGMLVKVRFS